MIIRFLFSLSLVLAFNGHAEQSVEGYEQSLLQTIQDIQHLNHDQALKDTRKFLKQYPTSKVGQLLYADLLLAKAEMLPAIGYGLKSKTKLKDLTFEIRQRMSNQQVLAHSGYLPENLISIAENQPYVLLMDQSQSRVYIYRNNQGTPELETDFFLSIGLKGSGKQKRGDQKTPIGVYHVTRYIDDRELPDLYGSGAFPVNYPNTWDIRKKRTGGGIWIHGTPSYTYNRAPWSSNGCMVVSNPDFNALENYIDPNKSTPVIVVKKINWITLDQWHENKRQQLQILSRWIKDWESNKHKNYTQHYSKTRFSAYGRNYSEWANHKEWVNRNKKDVSIEFSNLNIYLYPGEKDLVMMNYDQVYRSNNFSNQAAKELFWTKQKDGWKIVYEGIRNFDKPEDQLVEN